MTIIKRLLLGAEAGMFAASGAGAADLPVKAKAGEYMRVCSPYGAGFWYIPGTETCIKIGGFVRADNTLNGGAHGTPFVSGDGGQNNRYFDYWFARSRFALTFDTRTATEYGVVRTFGQADFQFNNFGTSNPSASTFTIGLPAGLSGTTLMGAGGGYAYPEYLFIQFAGFTFGKSSSGYSTPWMGYPANNMTFLMGGQDSATGVNNIQYTAQFGNGVSGTIGLDDPGVYNRQSVQNLSPGVSATGAGTFSYGGTHAPDVVGNVRVDQAWGLFQVSAAAHEVDASYNILGAGGVPTALSEISGHPDTKWGGSGMVALQIKNLPTGPGDDFKIEASYAKGDTKNIFSTSGPTPNFAMFGSSGSAYQSVGLGNLSDGIYLPGTGGTGGIILTTTWGGRIGYNHNWDAYWSSSIYGAYSALRYQGGANDNLTAVGTTSAKGAYCAAFAANHPGQSLTPGAAGTYSCNPDFNVAQAGIVTRWTPVKNLTFSGDLSWTHLDQKMVGSSVFTPTAPKPTALYEFKDQNTVFLELRVQRNF